MSGASERANGRASGPVLQSVFLAVIDHSVCVSGGVVVGAAQFPSWHGGLHGRHFHRSAQTENVLPPTIKRRRQNPHQSNSRCLPLFIINGIGLLSRTSLLRAIDEVGGAETVSVTRRSGPAIAIGGGVRPSVGS